MFAFGIPNPLVFFKRSREYRGNRDASQEEHDRGG